jgi:hypothetical protein
MTPVNLNPNPPYVLPQAKDHVQHLALPSVPTRERSLPRVTENDHGGSVLLRMDRSHLLGALGIPLPPPLPALDHSPSPHSSDEGVSHLHCSHAIAFCSGHVPTTEYQVNDIKLFQY